jgi:hypothetical protein
MNLGYVHMENDIPPNILDQKAIILHQDPRQIKPYLPTMKTAW